MVFHFITQWKYGGGGILPLNISRLLCTILCHLTEMLSRHFIWKHEFHNLDHLFNSSYLILNKDVLYYSEQQFLQGKYPKSDQNILDQGQQILDKDQIQPTVKLYWKTVMSTDLHIVYDYVHTCMVSCIKSCLTLQLHGRFLCPWDSPVKNTEGGCHFLLQGSYQPRHQTHVSYISCIGRWILYHSATWEATMLYIFFSNLTSTF